MATIASLSVSVDAKTGGFDRKMRGVDRKVESTRKTLRRFATVAAATTAAVTGVAVAMGKLTKRGGEVLGVQRAFARATGDVTGSLRQLRTTTLGVISDYELMAGLNRALALGSAQNVEEFEDLAKAGQALGRALGVDAAFAVESLNLGIGRQSRLILDNLGLIVSVEEANRKYADTLGVQVDQLTHAQTREAFRAEALEQARRKVEELGGVTETAADSWNRLTTAMGNFFDRMSVATAQSGPLAQFLDFMAEGVNIATQFGIVIPTAFGPQMVGGFGAGPQGEGSTRAERLRLLAGQRGQDPNELLRAAGLLEGEEGGGGSPLAALSRKAARAAQGLQSVVESLQVAAPTIDNHADRLRRATEGLALPGANLPGRARMLVQRDHFPGMQFAGPAGGALDLQPQRLAEVNFKIRQAGQDMEGMGDKASQAAQIAIAGFGGVVEAFARGSAQMEQVVVSAFTNILQNLPGVGGFAGAVIGAVGGIVGGLLGRANRPAPVRVEDYSSRAQNQMKDANPEPIVRVVFDFPDGIREPTDEDLRELGYRLGRIERKGGRV